MAAATLQRQGPNVDPTAVWDVVAEAAKGVAAAGGGAVVASVIQGARYRRQARETKALADKAAAELEQARNESADRVPGLISKIDQVGEDVASILRGVECLSVTTRGHETGLRELTAKVARMETIQEDREARRDQAIERIESTLGAQGQRLAVLEDARARRRGAE